MKEKIIKILNEIRPEFDFNETQNFIDQGMLDSFDIVTLVATIDEEFDISIDGLDIIPQNFSSVDSIINVLSKNGVSK